MWKCNERISLSSYWRHPLTPVFALSCQLFLNVQSHPYPLQTQSWPSHMVIEKPFPFLLLLRRSSPSFWESAILISPPHPVTPLVPIHLLHRMTTHSCLPRTEGAPRTWDYWCQNLENPGQKRWAGRPISASLLASFYSWRAQGPRSWRRNEQGHGMEPPWRVTQFVY